MISKVIQLHQENMGLRAFVAENITQTKILRDEINRLNQYIAMQHHHAQQYHHALLASQQHHQQSANMEATKLSSPSSTKSQTQQQSSLFEIISQDSLFQNEGQ